MHKFSSLHRTAATMGSRLAQADFELLRHLPLQEISILSKMLHLSILDKWRHDMRSFPSADLKQTLGDVLHAASQEPVTITRHKKPRYVLMSVRGYELRFQRDEREAHAVEEMPAEHLEMLEAAYTGQADGDR